MHFSFTRLAAALAGSLILAAASAEAPAPGSNPALRDVFTADPAPLVVGDTVYLYVGQDEARGSEMFTMNRWLAYSSKDLKTWTPHGPVMKATDFKWAVRDAWAAQVVQRHGKFYFYTTVQHDKTHDGKAIGVAVADHPLGPFKDARGSALITEQMTPGPYGWNDIDPTVFVDDDGTAWMAWGNPTLHLVKLKPNMIELDGPIEKVALPNYTEGPWISKRKGLYYLTYASMAHQGLWEHLSYATAPSMQGPWTYRGMITGTAKNSFTIHAGLIDDFKGQSYLVYHNATLTLGDQTGALGRRSVALEYLHYLDDGSIAPIVQTPEGLSRPPVIPTSKPAAPDHGRSDPRLRVGQFIQGYPSAWRGEPVLASVTSPFEQAPEPKGFNSHGGASRMAQTFVPKADFTLGRISLYAGDGHGTQADSPLRLALLDLGPASDSGADRYGTGPDLLSAGEGLKLAYQPQGPGLLDIDVVAGAPVTLKAGRRYALELRGARNDLSLYWRASRQDSYADGAAYLDGQLLKDKKDQPADFAFALYAKP